MSDEKKKVTPSHILSLSVAGLMGAGMLGGPKWKPVDMCSFCKEPIMNETDRMPNPTSCMSSECIAKWREARKPKK